MERYVSGVVLDKPICVVTLSGVNGSENAAKILLALHRAKIHTDVILLSKGDQVCFSAPAKEQGHIATTLQELKDLFETAVVSGRMIKLSLVGRDLRDPLGAAANAAEALVVAGVPVPYITSGDRMISFIIEECFAEKGMRLLHNFWLCGDTKEK